MYGRPSLTLIVMISFSGCQLPFGPIACTLEARSAFAVRAVDAGTGESLAPVATVWVRDGAFVDTLTAGPTGIYSGAHERPGRYEVVAEHPGYSNWRQTDVRVREDRCHVIPRELTARLTPAS